MSPAAGYVAAFPDHQRQAAAACAPYGACGPVFPVLAADGGNFRSWRTNAKAQLLADDCAAAVAQTLTDADLAMAGAAPPSVRVRALILLRCHLDFSLQAQYQQVDDPTALWQDLHLRFSNGAADPRSWATADWIALRLMDCESVAEFHSRLYATASQLRLCGVQLTEEDLIEKTLSTFPPRAHMLAQHYRNVGYKTYVDLMSALLLAEKHQQAVVRVDPRAASFKGAGRKVDTRTGRGDAPAAASPSRRPAIFVSTRPPVPSNSALAVANGEPGKSTALQQLYAGPTFLNSPAASALPVPSFMQPRSKSASPTARSLEFGTALGDFTPPARFRDRPASAVCSSFAEAYSFRDSSPPFPAVGLGAGVGANPADDNRSFVSQFERVRPHSSTASTFPGRRE